MRSQPISDTANPAATEIDWPPHQRGDRDRLVQGNLRPILCGPQFSYTRTGIADEVPRTLPVASRASATTYSGVPRTVRVVSKPERGPSTAPARAPGWVPERARHLVTLVVPFHEALTMTLPFSTCRPRAGWSSGRPVQSTL